MNCYENKVAHATINNIKASQLAETILSDEDSLFSSDPDPEESYQGIFDHFSNDLVTRLRKQSFRDLFFGHEPREDC